MTSNGWFYYDWNGEKIGPDERWHSRFTVWPEEKTARELKRSLKHVYDDFFAFEDKVLVEAYTVTGNDAKEHYELKHGFVMLMAIYTHPEARQKGYCKKFLKHAMQIADKHGGHLTAVCRPFHHKSEKEGEEIPTIKQIAKDFTIDPVGLWYEPVTEEEGKKEQQQMASTLSSLNWEKVDLSSNMELPHLFGDFGFMY
jgi:GNAT superfamily N-acetyltransferase